MKKVNFLMILAFATSINSTTIARAEADVKSKTIHEDQERGEEAFIKHADECLALMEESAQKMAVTGVAIIAFIPGDDTESWISKMKVVGTLANESANFLAIAYSKASEMATTFSNSGSAGREPLVGENGWIGGVVKKVNSGYILAAFSGATGEQDAALSKEGTDWLLKYF